MCPATLLTDPMAARDHDVRAAGEACVAAGLRAVSVWAHHLPALAGLGLNVAVVEAATTWAYADPVAAASEAEYLVGLVKEHRSSKILAVCLESELPDLDHARRNLAGLVDLAASAGAQVCVEFLPWSGIPDLATAWSLMKPLGPAAGIVLDTWHWQRQPGGPCPDLLATIPPARIGYVQVCDAAAEPEDDLMGEAMGGRLLPGEGVVDIPAVLAQLRSMGADPFVATEIFNPALVAELGAVGAARAMVDATRPLLA